MAYYEDYSPARDEPGRARSWLPIIALAALALLPVCIYLAPIVRDRWNESDPDFILKKRAVEAQVEADALYRLRQAELKAQAEAAATRLAKYEITPPPFRDIATRVGPAVVSVRNDHAERPPVNVQPQIPQGPQRNMFEPPFGPAPRAPRPRSEASGVIVKHEGDTAYVLTNAHVVRDATNLSVTFASGRSLSVANRQIFPDHDSDLAVLELDVSDVRHVVTAEWGDSDLIETGDWVVAIGNPFGFKGTVTAGIVSAKARDNALRDTVLREHPLNDIEFIQTDAAINPGSSGGPLLDAKGRLIGINTAIVTLHDGNDGVGFAVPGNLARRIFEELVQPPHTVTRGFLGVAGMMEVAPTDAARLRITTGVTFRQAPPGMPAAEAELRAGDVIVRFDGKEVTTMNQLRRLIMDKRPGTVVDLEVVRLESGNPDRRTVKVTLGDRAELMQRIPGGRR